VRAARPAYDRPVPKSSARWRPLAAILGALAACGADTDNIALDPIPSGVSKVERPALCERERADEVRDVFCGEAVPGIASLHDLQRLLQLTPDGVDQASLGYGPERPIAVLGHSTALSGHLVSPLNPRVIVIGEGTFLAFQRGVQRVELITRARNAGPNLNFYLLEFEQACNRSAAGCVPGDLFTPAIERDWLSVRLRDDEDLKNTPSDCRQCHQRARDVPRLLMRELNNPWTHFFEPPDAPDSGEPRVRGRDLMHDYQRAHGDERYAGFALERINALAPFVLEARVGMDQPVFFDAPGIEHERWPYGPDGYPAEPRPSAIWERAFEAFKRGEQLALPYLEQRATDPDKQAALSEAYARFRAGELSARELPDLRDIHPDDPQLRARIGLSTEPHVSPVDTLIQACGTCHNDVLDQSLSRARFNVDLARLNAAEIALAIARIELPGGQPGVMPPPEARQIEPGARAALLAYLRAYRPGEQSDERLQRAAALGMAGGGRARAPIPALSSE